MSDIKRWFEAMKPVMEEIIATRLKDEHKYLHFETRVPCCPNCSDLLRTVKCKLECPTCHTIVENCNGD